MLHITEPLIYKLLALPRAGHSASKTSWNIETCHIVCYTTMIYTIISNNEAAFTHGDNYPANDSLLEEGQSKNKR